jgi:hypothetical protein
VSAIYPCAISIRTEQKPKTDGDNLRGTRVSGSRTDDSDEGGSGELHGASEKVLVQETKYVGLRTCSSKIFSEEVLVRQCSIVQEKAYQVYVERSPFFETTWIMNGAGHVCTSLRRHVPCATLPNYIPCIDVIFVIV